MQIDYDKDLQSYFTDREYQRNMFQDFVSAKKLPKQLIVLHGVGGVGKSSLLRMFRLHCKNEKIPVALASGDDAKSVLDIVTRWAEDLKGDGIKFPALNKTLDSYRAIQVKVDDQAKKNQNRVADNFGVATGKTLWGMGAEALIDWLRGFLVKTDIELLLDPAKRLTEDFIEDIATSTEKKRIVLLLDTYEQMSALEDWIGEVAQKIHPNVLMVVAGRRLPDWNRVWSDWMINAQVEELKPMTEEVTRELIYRYYATMRGGELDPAQVEAIINLARGLPMVVTSAVQLWARYGVEDFQSVKAELVAGLVDRLMEGVSDEIMPALETAAVVRWFNLPILRAVMEQEDVSDVYNTLRQLPFVQARSIGLAVHDSVREMMDENLRIRDSERHAELHERAAIYFEKRLGKVAGSNQGVPGEESIRLKLERLYHRALVNEETGIKLFQEMAEELVRYKMTDQLKALLNDASSYLGIPPELVAEYKNPQKILSYSSELSNKGKKSTKEIKLLFVGQGSVGKTSLVKRLIWADFKPGESKTDGIAIEHWQLASNTDIENQKSQIQLNIWDFGGQEIMHATHQFFLTKRSLYLLVLDTRLTQEENRVEYWLKIIQSFGGESPVLIVGNKIDQHPLDIDRTGLQKKYPNIASILETSAATGAGIEELKATIVEQVNNLPHVRDLLPETWFTVKTKLEALGRESNFITHDKYLELCAENEVSDETSQRTLIGFLHDLGVVLHFQDDPRLESLGILNPQWVTNGVYKILNSHTLFQNKGVLTVSMLDEILNLPEYPRGKRLFIVDMMKKFELCYDIESDKTFLVPDLLPKDEPSELKFNGVPAFEYAYPVLPSSVITRFIVRMNQKIEDGFVWRTGVVLKIGDNTALVKADIEDRKITIAIDGVEHTRRDALSAIRYELGEIHNSIKGLNPQQRVPIPNAPSAEPLEYDYLLMLEREGDETCRVKDGNRLITVNVRQILSAIENESQRKNREGSVIIYGDVHTGGGDFSGRDKSISASDGGIIVGGDFSGNLVSGNYNKINFAEIAPELKDTLLQLAEAVNAMIEKLPADQAAEVAEDFGKLTDEAVKPKPNQKWYSVSIEGLIKAAENLDKLGTPVISLSRKVLSQLTSGMVK